ncbi:integrase [Pseudonocardia autotrophica]|uniref:DMT family permease n=3 Tax=Pseudonocardiaceae TaxID=2070 RepID=A0ABQ0RZP1_9PSEU|nr:putative prophage phiRv2 integrase [Pseudonocardia autotrophica]TDN72095.1 integrase [Pseudonocardia autotrophica]BBG02797.1 DMT family permease [Pseudonocardia autotrophica]GEC26116.1 DMT family permease [Pseudonocardia saturnea]
MAWVCKSARSTWRVRFRRDDGSIGTVNGFASETAARQHAESMETDQRRGVFLDPDGARTTVGEWVEQWLDALDVYDTTEAQYRSLLRNHILPRWGEHGLGEISAIRVNAWYKQLRADGYAASTVATIGKLLSMLLSDAADERLIAANPLLGSRRRRGKRRRERTPERPWATHQQALAIADNAARLPGAGQGAATLIVTAGWTGARWGELTGLQRHNLHLDPTGDTTSYLVIDPDIGALHEVGNRLFLGPPKTPESARTIALPPFLVPLLAAHLRSHPHRHVFVSPQGELHRRSNFSRRAMRPAADGTEHLARPAVAVPPARPGLTFHGLRHSHKTWMIADQIPDIAQARRLGHILGDKIAQTYSHVAAEVDARLLQGLQDRWDKAVADSGDIPDWRATP